MSKRSVAGSCLLLVCIAVMGACSPRIPVIPPVTLDVEAPQELCADESTGAEMSYTEAVAVAEQSVCAQEGALAATHACNAGTGTWWIDMDIEQPGCEPACVVDINTRTAEINWRCTGLLTPEAASPTPTLETATAEAPTATAPAPDDTTATPTLEPGIDWARYTNESYGFTFLYPMSWGIELLDNRPETESRASAVRLTRDDLQLLVEYKQPDEDVMIGPDNLPEGEVTEQGTLTLLERVLPLYVLEQEGREIVFFVGEQYVDLELYIEMRLVGEDIATAEISEEERADFDRIIATFARTGAAATDPYPGWASYEQQADTATAGFAFRFPTDWSLDDTNAAADGSQTLELRKDALVLQLHIRKPADGTVLAPDDLSSELVSEAGTVSFLGATIPRHVEVEDGQLKRIFINHENDAVQVYIVLSEDADHLSNADMAISDSARQTMDQILASFTVVGE
jgi:hypothetical protein